MVTKLIIGLVGMPASGKSTLAQLLEKKYKAHIVYLGQVIWDFLQKRGIKKTEELGAMTGLYLWADYDNIQIIRWAFSEIAKARTKIVVIDSLRTISETQALAQKYKSKFHIIAIVTAPAIRLMREKARARLGKVSLEEFHLRDRTELTIGAGDVIALADHYVVGNTSARGIEAQLAAIMVQIQKA